MRRAAQGMPELKLGLNDRLSGEGGGEGGLGGGAPSGREASKCVTPAPPPASAQRGPDARLRSQRQVHRAG